MKIIINTPGAFISKSGECFLLKKDEVRQEISAKKVEQILITTSATITTDAILLAMENNIDVVFLKYNGEPFGRVWHSKLGSITTIRRKQLYLQDNPFGMELVKGWITQKIDNQLDFFKRLEANREEEKAEIIQEGLQDIKEMLSKIKALSPASSINEVRESLQGYEGTAGRCYFKTLGLIIPPAYKFEGRSRNPARDYFNCMLNYSYGILYSQVEKSCILAGLDPYIGIMHTDNYNKKALVYDIVEMYRTYMDEIVFKLFSGKKINKDYFNNVEGGYYLNDEGKKVLIEAVNKSFEEKIRYKGRNIEMQNIMQYDCHNIANKILKEFDV